MKYYKILRDDLKHYDMQYQEGLNVDVRPFNPEPECGGGLFFTDAEHILDFLDYGNKIAEVEIPEGYLVIPVADKYKAHSIILKNIRKLKDKSLWKDLIKEGTDIHAGNDEAFLWLCENGYLGIAKWLYHLDGKIDIHARTELAFQLACSNGHLELAKWLYSLDGKINIHARDEYAFRLACEAGHLKMAKWLYKLDYNIHIYTHLEYAYRYACFNGHLKVVKWLFGLTKKKPGYQNYNGTYILSYSPEEIITYLEAKTSYF